MLHVCSMLVAHWVLQPVAASAAAFSVLMNSCQQEQSLSKLYPPPVDCARDGRAVLDPHCRLASRLSLIPGSPGDPGSHQSLLPCSGTAGQALPGKGPAALAPGLAPCPPGSSCLVLCPGCRLGLPWALRWHQGAQPTAVQGLPLETSQALVSHCPPELLVGPSPSHWLWAVMVVVCAPRDSWTLSSPSCAAWWHPLQSVLCNASSLSLSLSPQQWLCSTARPSI